ncbi:hypothetical protein MWN33_03050 [Starkeya koreensis]|uniref:Porin n=1 Tax=Ancylobacter koreensis TaxID=266121 RepID=A0ABT0DI96_9HYPH|nr:hypothetical protein [Ancylobacter koreensis]MCK0207005.1 hypothetical protein [Ancylobacter koreensis]
MQAATHRTLSRAAGAALLVTLLAGAAPAFAGNPPPPSNPPKPDPFCASFGPGFARVAGGSTCVKVSGGVQTDLYSTNVSGTRSGAPAPK